MRIKVWGTRGSIAVSNPESVRAGGNTTCFEVISDCLPQHTRLMIDAGTGFVPAGWHYLSEIGQGLSYVILFTHWHWDHVLGLTLSPPTFIDHVPMALYGPVDDGVGPAEMVEYIFKRPFFPVDAKRVTHKMSFHPLHDFDVTVILVHPRGGFAELSLERFVRLTRDDEQMPFGKLAFPLQECLVVRMQPTNHGNAKCISYRFEERPTGRTFVFCTDHEDETGIATDFRRHLAGADLVVMDAQYDFARYLRATARYGHGTPRNVARLGVVCGLKRVGITHHDPRSSDAFLEDAILPEARERLAHFASDREFLAVHGIDPDEVVLTDQDVFLCCDYAEIEV